MTEDANDDTIVEIESLAAAIAPEKDFTKQDVVFNITSILDLLNAFTFTDDQITSLNTNIGDLFGLEFEIESETSLSVSVDEISYKFVQYGFKAYCFLHSKDGSPLGRIDQMVMEPSLALNFRIYIKYISIGQYETLNWNTSKLVISTTTSTTGNIDSDTEESINSIISGTDISEGLSVSELSVMWSKISAILTESGFSAASDVYIEMANQFFAVVTSFLELSYNYTMTTKWAAEDTQEFLSTLTATLEELTAELDFDEINGLLSTYFESSEDTNLMTGQQLKGSSLTFFSYMTDFLDEDQLISVIDAVNNQLATYSSEESFSSDLSFSGSYQSFLVDDFGVFQLKFASITADLVQTYLYDQALNEESDLSVYADDLKDSVMSKADGLTSEKISFSEMLSFLDAAITYLETTDAEVDLISSYKQAALEGIKDLYLEALIPILTSKYSFTLFSDWVSSYLLDPSVYGYSNLSAYYVGRFLTELAGSHDISSVGVSGFGFLQLGNEILKFVDSFSEKSVDLSLTTSNFLTALSDFSLSETELSSEMELLIVGMESVIDQLISADDTSSSLKDVYDAMDISKLLSDAINDFIVAELSSIESDESDESDESLIATPNQFSGDVIDTDLGILIDNIANSDIDTEGTEEIEDTEVEETEVKETEVEETEVEETEVEETEVEETELMACISDFAVLSTTQNDLNDGVTCALELLSTSEYSSSEIADFQTALYSILGIDPITIPTSTTVEIDNLQQILVNTIVDTKNNNLVYDSSTAEVRTSLAPALAVEFINSLISMFTFESTGLLDLSTIYAVINEVYTTPTSEDGASYSDFSSGSATKSPELLTESSMTDLWTSLSSALIEGGVGETSETYVFLKSQYDALKKVYQDINFNILTTTIWTYDEIRLVASNVLDSMEEIFNFTIESYDMFADESFVEEEGLIGKKLMEITATFLGNYSSKISLYDTDGLIAETLDQSLMDLELYQFSDLTSTSPELYFPDTLGLESTNGFGIFDLNLSALFANTAIQMMMQLIAQSTYALTDDQKALANVILAESLALIDDDYGISFSQLISAKDMIVENLADVDSVSEIENEQTEFLNAIYSASLSSLFSTTVSYQYVTSWKSQFIETLSTYGVDNTTKTMVYYLFNRLLSLNQMPANGVSGLNFIQMAYVIIEYIGSISNDAIDIVSIKNELLDFLMTFQLHNQASSSSMIASQEAFNIDLSLLLVAIEKYQSTEAYNQAFKPLYIGFLLLDTLQAT